MCIRDRDWAEYSVKNQQIIWGWLEYNMILYIQKRNPNVPGIADQLYPPKERKLEKIKNYWKLILSLEPIRDIYGDEILTCLLYTSKKISLQKYGKFLTYLRLNMRQTKAKSSYVRNKRANIVCS